MTIGAEGGVKDGDSEAEKERCQRKHPGQHVWQEHEGHQSGHRHVRPAKRRPTSPGHARRVSFIIFYLF